MKKVALPVVKGLPPKKVQDVWGEKFLPAIRYLSEELTSIGFVGPASWKQTHSIPFLLDVSDSVRVCLGLSRVGGVGVVSKFDSVAVVLSSTIYKNSLPTDPWQGGGGVREKWHDGYVACLTFSLSHLKWASVEQSTNPFWLMTVDADSELMPNATSWLLDFEALLFPVLTNLRTDVKLAEAMLGAINYVRPGWVKSDGPGFGRIHELVNALNR